MVKLPPKILGIIGLLIICLHDLFPLIQFAEKSVLKTILTPFFTAAAIPLFAGKIFVVAYPPIPWLGIMLVGFASGQFFDLAAQQRKKIFVQLGLGALFLFGAVRFINRYGDPAHWATQKSALFSFLSFLNFTKYPPSLVFCLATLGIMFLLLSVAEQHDNWFTRVASVYGKVPLFYFIIHFYLIHILTLIMLFLQGFHFSQLEFANGTFGRPGGVVSGVPLWTVYLTWLGVVIALYKLCVWFAQYKTTHRAWWLRYI